MERLTAHWEEMEMLILETLVPSHVMEAINYKEVVLEDVKEEGCGMVPVLYVKQVEQ